MSCTFGSARGSYGNTSRGDQNGGREVSTQSGYVHSKGWYIFRAKDPEKRKLMAYAMDYFCNKTGLLLGYSQPDRMALYNQLKTKAFDPTKLKEKSNCDCSSLTRVCMLYAGINVPNFTTANMRSVVMATGEFYEIKFTSLSKVAAGDSLCTKTKGHVVICTKSDYVPADSGNETTIVHTLGSRELKNGCSGDDVKDLQMLLIDAGYDLGKFGADGEYGDCTERAIREFQSNAGIIVSGIATIATINALTGSFNDSVDTGSSVKINGGNCYVRTDPNVDSSIIGTAYNGTTYVYANETSVQGWLKILYSGTTGWVSGKYGKRV